MNLHSTPATTVPTPQDATAKVQGLETKVIELRTERHDLPATAAGTSSLPNLTHGVDTIAHICARWPSAEILKGKTSIARAERKCTANTNRRILIRTAWTPHERTNVFHSI